MDFYVTFGAFSLIVCTLLRGADIDWGTRTSLEMLCDVSMWGYSICNLGALFCLFCFCVVTLCLINYVHFQSRGIPGFLHSFR